MTAAVIVVGYVAAGFLAWRATTSTSSADRSVGAAGYEAVDSRRLRGLWMATTIIVAGFGVNRALRTHEWLMHRLRDAVSAEGLYLERRRLQAIVLILIAGIGLLGVVASWLLFRRALRRAAGPLVGLALLVSYVAVRVVSLHDIDVSFSRGPVSAGRVVEISGLALISASAIVAMKPRRRATTGAT